jgi:hypothetical protein
MVDDSVSLQRWMRSVGRAIVAHRRHAWLARLALRQAPHAHAAVAILGTAWLGEPGSKVHPIIITAPRIPFKDLRKRWGEHAFPKSQ